MDEKANRKVKDSVFTDLFSRKEYTVKLYKALFPNDTEEITEDDIEIITLENVLLRDIYNDLGIRVKNKLILLVEEQSTWSLNITLRLFLYLASAYKEHIVTNKIDLYTTKVPDIPQPELFVIYTGDRKNVPASLSLSEIFFGGSSVIDLNVKVITDGKKGDIISQYVKFAKVVTEQIKLYGNKKKAITETLRICKDEDVLREYLIECEKEVISMLDVLFDHEFIAEAHDNTVREEGRQEGRREGRQEGRSEGILSSIRSLISKMKISVTEAMDLLSIPESERAGYLKMLGA